MSRLGAGAFLVVLAGCATPVVETRPVADTPFAAPTPPMDVRGGRRENVFHSSAVEAARAQLATGRDFAPGDAPLADPGGRWRLLLVPTDRPPLHALQVADSRGRRYGPLVVVGGPIRVALSYGGDTLYVGHEGLITTWDLGSTPPAPPRDSPR